MSERIETHLREAKPAAGGGGIAGLVTGLLGWLKEHIPAVLRPNEYAVQRIDLDRARTRMVDADARVREAEARRLELENAAFSRRGALLEEKMAMHLLNGPGADGALQAGDVPSIDQAAAALRAAADHLQALGIDVHVSLTRAQSAGAEATPPSVEFELPPGGGPAEADRIVHEG
jgi:hypothetical protein